MSERDGPAESDLPAHTRESELEELEPHQQRIERAARLYYAACDRIARAIRTVKGYLGDHED